MTMRRARALWREVGGGWHLALWLLILLRLSLGLVAVLSLHLNAPAGPEGDWAELLIEDGEPWSELLSTWQRWDALWYQQIATHGYAAGDGTAAFYPLYPFLARVVSLPLGGHVVWAELLVSSAAFAAALWLLYQVARLDAGPVAARLAVLLTALFPTGFFFLAPYTESLFLGLTLAAFWLARQGRPWAAGVAGCLAALTRAQGVLLALPLAFEQLRQRRDAGRRPDLGLLAAAGPLLGWLAVAAFQRLVVGEPRAALDVLGLWGYEVVAPWEALAASWAHIAAGGDREGGSLAAIEALNLACLLGFSGLAVVATRRLPLAYTLYVWPSLLLLFTRAMWFSPLMSVSRYTLVLFPCFIMLGLVLVRCPWFALAWLVVSTLLQVQLLQHWVNWGFVA